MNVPCADLRIEATPLKGHGQIRYTWRFGNSVGSTIGAASSQRMITNPQLRGLGHSPMHTHAHTNDHAHENLRNVAVCGRARAHRPPPTPPPTTTGPSPLASKHAQPDNLITCRRAARSPARHPTALIAEHDKHTPVLTQDGPLGRSRAGKGNQCARRVRTCTENPCIVGCSLSYVEN